VFIFKKSMFLECLFSKNRCFCTIMFGFFKFFTQVGTTKAEEFP